VFDRQILVVRVLFSFCGVSESGSRGIVAVPPAFMVVSIIVSTLPVVLATERISSGATCICGGVHDCFHTAGSIGIVLNNPGNFTIDHCVADAILPSSKLRDNKSASMATGGGSNGGDNMASYHI
jgi:hypothetical protein